MNSSLKKNHINTEFQKMKATYTCFFFIEQAVLSLIKSIFTEMKYFSQNIIEPSCIGICTCMLQTI